MERRTQKSDDEDQAVDEGGSELAPRSKPSQVSSDLNFESTVLLATSCPETGIKRSLASTFCTCMS